VLEGLRGEENISELCRRERHRRLDLLLDGNREQRSSETEFVTVGVN